jgi:hypothetical protein
MNEMPGYGVRDVNKMRCRLDLSEIDVMIVISPSVIVKAYFASNITPRVDDTAPSKSGCHEVPLTELLYSSSELLTGVYIDVDPVRI